jgi:hypothetical protein
VTTGSGDNDLAPPSQDNPASDTVTPPANQNGVDPDRRRLKFLICSCPHLEYSEYGGLLTFRIYLCKQAVGVLEDGRPKEAFDRAAQKMLTAIRRLGEGSPDKLLASRRLGRSSEECQFSAERVFQFIGAIVYDMEWTSAEGESDFENAATLADATNTISPGFALQYSCWHFVRHMLLVDYGFSAPPLFQHWRSPRKVEDAIWTFERFCGFVSATAWRWRQGHGIPDQRAWDLIIDVLAGSITWQCPLWTWDAAIMFYYYYSRRKLVSPQERREGWTGYTGVLQEMIAEVSTRGRERLQRKLSLDVHLFPSIIKDKKRCKQMTAMALDLAGQHGCKIELPSQEPAPGTPRS